MKKELPNMMQLEHQNENFLNKGQTLDEYDCLFSIEWDLLQNQTGPSCKGNGI